MLPLLYDAGTEENSEESLKQNIEMTSMIPSQTDMRMEHENIVRNIQSKFDWLLGEHPLNEFNTCYNGFSYTFSRWGRGSHK